MPKRAKEKTAAQVRQIKRPGLHSVGGVAGLCLQVGDNGAKSWILRAVVGGRRRAIGLGPFPDVTLASAREKAREYRDAIREGRDPAAERQAAHDAMRAAQGRRLTFDDAARRYLAAKRSEFRNPKHAAQWESTLEAYASPVIGNLPVSEITVAHIVNVLEPYWHSRTETATRVRGRIEKVLAWATTSGYRSGDNPARWRGNLDTVLPAPTKLKKVQHHPALPYTEAPAFIAELRQRTGMAARCLEFITLTACRSGEARGATWDEIDLDGKTWTIPAERMKAQKAQRVPLPADAVALLEALPTREGYLFPSSKRAALTDAGVSKVLKALRDGYTVHGLRSTFRDWAAERTGYPNEVIEAALAHTVSDKVERAYRRGDLFARRARLMSDWAGYLRDGEPVADVVPLRGES